jgi:hypothetical protein
MDSDSDHDILDAHPAIPVIEQTDVAADTSEADALYLMPLLDSLTFRGKLLKIKPSDKHETSQECRYQCAEEFLLN